MHSSIAAHRTRPAANAHGVGSIACYHRAGRTLPLPSAYGYRTLLSAGRNQTGLTERQIAYCIEAWTLLCGELQFDLDIADAGERATRTRFIEGRNIVVLGADVMPGGGMDANSRMSTMACLAHELAHAERFHLGYRRPTSLPDMLLDEAEASIRASFTPDFGVKDREDLVEDARDRLIQWLALPHHGGDTDAR